MTIKEANNKVEKIDNDIEYYLKKKEKEFAKTQPQAVKIKDIVTTGGKRVDKFSKYVISIKEIDNILDDLYSEKRILEEYIEKELIRLNKYSEVEQLIVYYKEQNLENLTWVQISMRVHYSVRQCKRIYRNFVQKRDV